jgi:hypothetical protein
MPAKKKNSTVPKRAPAKVKKAVATAAKKGAASSRTTRTKKSTTTATAKGRKVRTTAPRLRTSRTLGAVSSSPEPNVGFGSAQLVAEDVLRVFTGVVRISGNQSILNGSTLIRAGVADFPSAMGAATQYLTNQGIGDGDNVSVTGEAKTVEYGGQSIQVIVMTSAQKS